MNFEWFDWYFIIGIVGNGYVLIHIIILIISHFKKDTPQVKEIENLKNSIDSLSKEHENLRKEYVWNCEMSSNHYMKERIVYYFSKYRIPLDDINSFIFSNCLTKENVSTITDIVYLQRENFNCGDYVILMNLLKQDYSQ